MVKVGIVFFIIGLGEGMIICDWLRARGLQSTPVPLKKK